MSRVIYWWCGGGMTQQDEAGGKSIPGIPLLSLLNTSLHLPGPYPGQSNFSAFPTRHLPGPYPGQSDVSALNTLAYGVHLHSPRPFPGQAEKLNVFVT
jgi:hypothetical protein